MDIMGWFGRPKKDALMTAAAKGDAAEVERLLVSGAEIDWANEQGLTALMMASYAGRTAIVRMLLEAKADYLKPNLDGETPLFVSANTAAAQDIVPMLLAAGAEVNATAKGGRTPLSAHAQGGSLKAVRALLDADARVDEADDRGVTPLLLAVDNGHRDVVLLLLERGADPARRMSTEHGASPLGAAIAKGDDAMAEILIGVVDPNDGAFDDEPALFFAVKKKRARLVPRLVERGAALEFCHPEVGSALAAAVVGGDLPTVDALLAAGVPIGLRSATGAQALHLAAYAGHLAAVEHLITAGADIHALTGPRGTPLRAAAAKGHVEIVRLLITLGADPAPVDAFSRRPIDDAREGKHLEVVRLLETSARLETPSRQPPGRPPLLLMLPERSDASLRGVKHGIETGSMVMRAGCSSVEAPTMVRAIREMLPEYELTYRVDEPDPRIPIRPVNIVLWRYPNLAEGVANAEPAVAAPSADLRVAVGRIALVPYLLRVWSERAARTAAELKPKDAHQVAAVMVHPPVRPAHIEPWDWWFRVQVAAALLLSHLGSEPWASSRRRQVLEDLIDGPTDWANTAAIIALYDIARRDVTAREAVVATLAAITRRPVTAPVYQHAIQPAALALLEMPDLADDLRSTLTTLLREGEE